MSSLIEVYYIHVRHKNNVITYRSILIHVRHNNNVPTYRSLLYTCTSQE